MLSVERNMDYGHFDQLKGTFHQLLDLFYQLKGTLIMVTFIS